MTEYHDGLPIVHRTELGVAVLWFKTNKNTRDMYRIYYANGRDPLATNTMEIVREQLGDKRVAMNVQLSLF
jgi:hypothetical protein